MSETRASTIRSGPRPWRTITLAVFLLALVVQGFLSFAIRPEPYPTIRMPAFGLAASPEGTIQVTFVSAVATFDDGTTESIEPTEIMSQFRFSTARPSWDYVFHPDRPNDPSDEVVTWLGERVEALTGRRAVELGMCWMTADVDIRDASLLNEQPCQWRVVPL